MLEDIVYSLRKAQKGRLSLYAQRALDRECRAIPLTQEERFAYSILQNTINVIPQWSDEEALKADMQKIGGRVLFCHYFVEHDSMAELTQDCTGEFSVDYILLQYLWNRIWQPAIFHSNSYLSYNKRVIGWRFLSWAFTSVIKTVSHLSCCSIRFKQVEPTAKRSVRVTK